MLHEQSPEILAKVRQLFDSAPYPRVPLERSPKEELERLALHNLVVPYYLRNQKVIDTAGKVLLDAGCGSGYKALALAEANPGAKIIGVDISANSVELAKQRLEYHGFQNCEFYAMPMEDLPSLGLQFDYINCDEVLYLIPDPLAGLQAMQATLSPQGIIRVNLHSLYQRTPLFRMQQAFQIMGLFEDTPGELEIGIVREVMMALNDQLPLRQYYWDKDFETEDERVLANYLLQGDKGFTLADFFGLLDATGLEFINMVNWHQWQLSGLFKDSQNLPAFLAMSLPDTPIETKLQLFELIHPRHRLLDLWCGHPDQGLPFSPPTEWSEQDWHQAKIWLHPQLKTEETKEDLLLAITRQSAFEVNRRFKSVSTQPVLLESTVAAILLPLWDAPQTLESLTQRWLQIRPLNPATLEPTSIAVAEREVKQVLINLETFLFVMMER